MLTPSLNQMLLASWRQRNLDAPWGRAAFVALGVLTLAIGLVMLPNIQARAILTACVLSGTVFGIWINIVASLLEQNHPNAARFVPHHLQRLREAALLAWLPLSALLGVLLWLSMARLPSLPVLLLGSAATGVFVAWAQRQWLLWFLLCFVPAFVLPLRLHVRWAPLWAALGDIWQAQTWSVLALCMLVLGALLTRVFGNGSDAHRAGYARRSCMRKAALDGMTGQRAGLSAFGIPGEWLGRPFDRIAAAWLRHVVANARPTPASVMARAEIVLHGLQHWLRQLLGFSLALLFVGLGFAIAIAVAGAKIGLAWQAGSTGMAIGLASAGFNPGFTLRNMLWHSRREQALLALLPGMPQGQALNRAVAWRQMRHFLGAWGLTTLSLVVLAGVARQPLMLCLPIAALPVAIVTLIRAPARMKAPRAWTAVLPTFGFFLLGGALWALSRWLALPLGLLAGVGLAGSAALAAWRWRAIGAAPAAMPAGRLA